MFHRINPQSVGLHIYFDGVGIAATEGETVAAALLAAGIVATRDTTVKGTPRGPFCMMGVCFDCLVEIDGVANRQACMTIVRDGMAIARQRGARVFPG